MHTGGADILRPRGCHIEIGAEQFSGKRLEIATVLRTTGVTCLGQRLLIPGINYSERSRRLNIRPR